MHSGQINKRVQCYPDGNQAMSKSGVRFFFFHFIRSKQRLYMENRSILIDEITAYFLSKTVSSLDLTSSFYFAKV